MNPTLRKDKVWVPSTIEKDLANARQYGEVEAIVLSYVPEIEGCEQIEARLRDHSTPTDFLVMAGNPVYQAHAYYCMLTIWGSVNCLCWDRKTMAYRLVKISA